MIVVVLISNIVFMAKYPETSFSLLESRHHEALIDSCKFERYYHLLTMKQSAVFITRKQNIITKIFLKKFKVSPILSFFLAPSACITIP